MTRTAYSQVKLIQAWDVVEHTDCTSYTIEIRAVNQRPSRCLTMFNRENDNLSKDSLARPTKAVD